MEMAGNNASMILELKSITKQFGSLVAVDNVSFSLERGKLVQESGSFSEEALHELSIHLQRIQTHA
jgi:ABC-type uncharacterized transport system ATPase subunit